MQVGGAFPDRIEQELLQETDDRRVVDLGRVFGRGLGRLSEQLVEGHVVTADHALERLRRGLGVGVDQPHQLVVLDHDDVEGQLRLELDLVQRLEVRRVGHRDREPVATLAQRDDAQRTHELAVDDVPRQLFVIDRGEVEQRMTEGVCGELRDGCRVQAGDFRRADQLIDELRVRLQRLASEVLGAVRSQLALLHQCARKPGQRSCSGRTLDDGRHRLEELSSGCRIGLANGQFIAVAPP